MIGRDACGVADAMYKKYSEAGFPSAGLIMTFAAIIVLLSGFMPLFAGPSSSQPALAELKARVKAMEKEAQLIEEENRGIRNMLSPLESDDVYLVVDTENNVLTMRQGQKILLVSKVGTGSRQYIKEETGRSWMFESPTGSLTVLGKERNPVWIRPDWSYVEENMPVPPDNDPDRIVRGVLGKYALLLGSGYKIHGTKYQKLLGTHFTHGCVSVNEHDLELLHDTVKIGTKVYIY